MVDAPSASPMVFRSRFLPLKLKEDVRPITFRSFIFVIELRISSAMPSPKYSWSLPGLKSIKERTAIDLSLDTFPLVDGDSIELRKYPARITISGKAIRAIRFFLFLGTFAVGVSVDRVTGVPGFLMALIISLIA